MEPKVEVEPGAEVEIDPLTGVETPIEVEAKVDGEVETTGDEPAPRVDEPEEKPINQEAVQKRINEITTDKYAEKRRADDLERQLKELQGKQKAIPSEAPTLEQFDFDEEKHTEALIKHQVAKQLADQSLKNTQDVADNKRQTVAKEFFTKEAEFIAKHPEYQEAVKNLPLFPPETLDVIYELGPDLSNYLATHLDVADAVASVSPALAGVKLGQIATKLSVKKPEVKPSNAPNPITTISGGATVNKSQEDMSMAEIMALD